VQLQDLLVGLGVYRNTISVLVKGQAKYRRGIVARDPALAPRPTLSGSLAALKVTL
jgi:hypothetical protein